MFENDEERRARLMKKRDEVLLMFENDKEKRE